MESIDLLSPIKINNWTLRNRIVMAPMTRGFADDITGTVGEDITAYYRRRANDGIGLIITEGINPSRRGKGTFGIPGLYLDEHVHGWRNVTEAVHEEGGTIIAQLWHVGRLTHHELTGGLPPLAPSKVKATGHVHRLRKPYEIPEEMTINDIREVINQYALSARNAITAGFDGVEIHAAHGYLIDQFISEKTNTRIDQYGGGITNRLMFLKEVLQAVVNEVGVEKTIVRFSEIKDDDPHYRWKNPDGMIQALMEVFNEVGIQILHPSTNHFTERIQEDMTLHQLVRKYWRGIIIGVGDLDIETAAQAIEEGTVDLAAFGRPLLANPDFIHRIKNGKELIPYNSKVHLKNLY